MADQKVLRKRLEKLLKQDGNDHCVDCKKRGPRWASANLGVFMCIDCSGIHRALGVHISFVRSVNLDSWQEKQVEFMEKWGNDRVNAIFEGNLPPNFRRPSDSGPITELKRFIVDKYEYKRFKIDESKVPPPKEINDRGAFGSDEGFGSSSGSGTAKAAPAAPAKPAASLIDFFDDPAPPAAPAAPAAFAAPASVFDSPGGAVQFDAFQTSATAPAATGFASDPFAVPSAPAPAVPAVPAPSSGAAADPFFSPQAVPQQEAPQQQQQQQQQVPPQQPKASNADIMSLFNAPAQMPGPGQMQGGMGAMSPQMGGMPGQMMPGQMGGMPGQMMPGQMGGMPGQMMPGQMGGMPGQMMPGQTAGQMGTYPQMQSQGYPQQMQQQQFAQQQHQQQQQHPPNQMGFM